MSEVPVSAYITTCGMLYFARMIDKIRKAAGACLRDDFVANLGAGFDARCCDYLRVEYPALCARVLQGGTDEEIFNWCMQTGRPLNEGDIHVWNEFLRKVGWNDSVTEILVRRKAESGLSANESIQCMLDYFDWDEGRR